MPGCIEFTCQFFVLVSNKTDVHGHEYPKSQLQMCMVKLSLFSPLRFAYFGKWLTIIEHLHIYEYFCPADIYEYFCPRGPV